jgi:hypothetical protein
MYMTGFLANRMGPASVFGYPSLGPDSHTCIINAGLTNIEIVNICLLLIGIGHRSSQDFVNHLGRTLVCKLQDIHCVLDASAGNQLRYKPHFASRHGSVPIRRPPDRQIVCLYGQGIGQSLNVIFARNRPEQALSPVLHSRGRLSITKTAPDQIVRKLIGTYLPFFTKSL